MTSLKTELDRLQHQIAQTGTDDRFRYQPQLRRLMLRMDEQGENIPPETKRLHEELLCEAIEAQFDNMPV